MSTNDYTFKICVCGDKNVGKSCLIKQYFEKVFEEQQPTIGIECQTKELEIDSGIKVKTMVWDTSGDPKYKEIFPQFFKGAHGVILAYDITSLQSFERMIEYYVEIRNICGENVVILLSGNKADLSINREVSIAKAEAFAFDNKMAFMETSAKCSINVQEAFMMIAKGIYMSRNKEAGGNRSKKEWCSRAHAVFYEESKCYIR